MSTDILQPSSVESNNGFDQYSSNMDIDDSTPCYMDTLYEDDPLKCLDGVTQLKNSVIGSNRQKAAALRHGVLPRILQLLGDPSKSVEIRRESCVILGSLVKGTADNVRDVVNASSVPTLVAVLSTPDVKLIEYSLSCLTTIFSHSFAPTEILYSDAGFIPHLLSLMNQSVTNQISVATILSHSCSTLLHQQTLADHGVVPPLAALLTSPNAKVQMPAINCLTSLSYKNERVSTIIAETMLDEKSVPDLLVGLICRDKPAKMQLTVARCLTYLHRANALCSTDPKVCMKTLPCLVRMCSKDNCVETRILAAETLAYLIEVDKDLQSIAAISNHLIPTLADYLKCQPIMYKPLLGTSVDMIQAAFQAYASLGANDEHIRKRIIETDTLMERVVTAMDDSNETVALAAVRCLHSLSRSVQQLRTTFKDHSVWKPLMKLLQHPSQDILNVSSSTLCNLLLEFSPSKEPILEAGAVEILCGLTRHSDAGLRINGIWALMNVAFQADQRVKGQILTSLGTEQLFKLLSDSETTVVMKTVGLLRNLVSAPHIDHIMDLYGKQIMQAITMLLDSTEATIDVKEQTLCLLSNIADGYSAKEFIMSNEDVLKKVVAFMNHTNPKLQTAAVVCVSNLAWKEEEGSQERQVKLKDLGVQKCLHSLITTSDQNLFDRVKTALNQFSSN